MQRPSAWVLMGSLLLLFLPSAMAQQRTVTLAWTAPATHVDGSPVKPGDIAGYRLYHAVTPGAYTFGQQPYISVPATSTQMAVPTDYGWYWVVTAMKANGRESGPSNEVQVTDDRILGAPGALRILQVQESRVIQESRTVVYALP